MLLFPLWRLEFKSLTPPITHAQFASMNFVPETKFEKGASDRNSRPGRGRAGALGGAEAHAELPARPIERSGKD